MFKLGFFSTAGLILLYLSVLQVHDVKKSFYKKFIYEPFPVESSLLSVLSDHLNAEVVAGTVKSRQEALDYLTWTYFFRRLLRNPTYYGLVSLEEADINRYLSSLIENTISELEKANCVVTLEVTWVICMAYLTILFHYMKVGCEYVY